MAVEYSFGSIASDSKMLIFDRIKTVCDSWFLYFSPTVSLCSYLTGLHHLSRFVASLLLVVLIYDIEVFIHHYKRMLRRVKVHLREIFLRRDDYLLTVQRLKGILRKFDDWWHTMYLGCGHCSFCVTALLIILSSVCSIQIWIALKMVAWFTKIESDYWKILFVSIILRAEALLYHISFVLSLKSIIIIINIHILLLLVVMFSSTLWRIWFPALHEESILFKLIKVSLYFTQILICSTPSCINALPMIHSSSIAWQLTTYAPIDVHRLWLVFR